MVTDRENPQTTFVKLLAERQASSQLGRSAKKKKKNLTCFWTDYWLRRALETPRAREWFGAGIKNLTASCRHSYVRCSAASELVRASYWRESMSSVYHYQHVRPFRFRFRWGNWAKVARKRWFIHDDESSNFDAVVRKFIAMVRYKVHPAGRCHASVINKIQSLCYECIFV